MRVEEHTRGVTVNGPAVVIRDGALLSGLIAQQAENATVCPKCGQSGFSCCTYADRAELSSEGLALARQPVNPAEAEQAETNDTGSAVARPVATPSAPLTSARAGSDSDTSTSNHPAPGSETVLGQPRGDVAPGAQPQQAGQEDSSKQKQGSGSKQEELSDEEKQEIQEMKARDREVRSHEQAHLAAAGSQAQGGANYEFEEGPDGQKYAVAGDVSIRFGGDTPEERLRQAEQAARAALAPAEPSAQDRAVAAEARAEATRARGEMAQQESGSGETDSAPAAQPSDEDEESSATVFTPADKQAEEPDSPLPNPFTKAADAYRSQSIPSTASSAASLPQSFTLEQAMFPGRLVAISA